MILVVTFNPAIDWNLLVDQNFPHSIHDSRRVAGGKGLNVNRVLKRLGTPNRAFAPLGGPTGSEIARLSEHEGIRIQSVPIRSCSRVNLTIVTPDGRSARFNQLGPLLSIRELSGIRRVLKREIHHASVIVFSGSIPPGISPGFLTAMVRMVTRLGKKAVVDTSGPALAAIKKIPVWLLKPNEEEWKSIHRSAPHAEWILVSRGHRGAELRHRGNVWKANARPIRIRCTVGAGDSLLAGFLHEYFRSHDAVRALKFAVRCGAASVSNGPGRLADVATLRKIRGNVRLCSRRAA